MLGEKHPDTLISLHNHADVLRVLGHGADALKQFERALTLRGEVLGNKYPATLTTLNNTAAVLHGMGRSADALPLLERH